LSRRPRFSSIHPVKSVPFSPDPNGSALIEQARYLSEEEFEIDRMLGVAPSNHLRRILGRFGYHR
ncbi:MAG: hypothetical protein ACOYOF_19025, partial [Verrucomicrobiaceae bacterium]